MKNKDCDITDFLSINDIRKPRSKCIMIYIFLIIIIVLSILFIYFNSKLQKNMDMKILGLQIFGFVFLIGLSLFLGKKMCQSNMILFYIFFLIILCALGFFTFDKYKKYQKLVKITPSSTTPPLTPTTVPTITPVN